MATISFILVRLLALYVGTQTVMQLGQSLRAFRLANELDFWLPYIVGTAMAVGLWLAARPLSHAIADDGTLTRARDDRFGIDATNAATILQIAFIVVGVVLATRAISNATSILNTSADPISLFVDEPAPSWFALNGGPLAANLVQLGIGLYLVFRGRAPAAVLAKLRDWYAMESPDEERR